MKLQDVKIGERYLAKVSRSVCVVRVIDVRQATTFNATRTVIDAINEATGRRITIRSPQRLRCRWDG